MALVAWCDNQFRIIAGRWRGRRIHFIADHQLRPTPDRVRETVFNWLSPLIDGACCLDAFAGSGALGLEALSRGAEKVIFLEKKQTAAQRLRENIELLNASAQVEAVDAVDWLRQPRQTFDLVFLDPPFDQALLPPVCELLNHPGWLKPAARIYLEMRQPHSALQLPPSWRWLRQQSAGQVNYGLAVAA